MEQDLVIPTIETVRARRRQIADEDMKLAEIERKLLEAADEWASVTKARPKVFASGVSLTGATAFANAVTAEVPRRRLTKNAAIIEALSPPRDLWQTANQIREHTGRLLGKDVPMSSISPALTDLKKTGTIARRDMTVALVLRLEKEEPNFLYENGEAEASPETDGVATPSAVNPASSGA